MKWLLALCMLAGCKRVHTTSGVDAPPSIAVTIERRPSLKAAHTLIVRVTGAGGTNEEYLSVALADLPVLYSIPVDGRTGKVEIVVDALDAGGNLAGRGTTTTAFEMSAAIVTLTGADFVVNSSFTGDQFLTNDFEAGGLQLAAIDDSSWVAVFREACTTCNVYGRRFDVLGNPAPATTGGIGTDQFTISTMPTSAMVPAVAASETATSPAGSDHTTLVVWDLLDPNSSALGVACRGFSEEGVPTSPQTTLSTDPADVVTVNPVGNGNFVVTWQAFVAGMQVIRSMIVTRACAAVTPTPLTVSTLQTSIGARRSHAAGNGQTLLYAWIVDGDVHARTALPSGEPITPDRIIMSRNPSQHWAHVRVVPWGADFAMAVRAGDPNGVLLSSIELYRVSANAEVIGGPYRISDHSASDFTSNQAFGIAARPSGLLFVAWHNCLEGPGSCDVYGRFVRLDGSMQGDEMQLATTTGGDQYDPSVAAVGDVFIAAWNDTSSTAPDLSGGAVRARVIYPGP